jgi:hypothetical protein
MRTRRAALHAPALAPSAVTVVVVSMTLAFAASAGAEEGGTTTVTVDGSALTVMVDPGPGGAGGEDELRTFLEVDGSLHELDEALVPDDVTTGDAVTVTLEASAGLTPEEALAIATGTADATAPSAASAEVAEVAEVPDPARDATSSPVPTAAAPAAGGPSDLAGAESAESDSTDTGPVAEPAGSDPAVSGPAVSEPAGSEPAGSEPAGTGATAPAGEQAPVVAEGATAPAAEVTDVDVSSLAASELAEAVVGNHTLTVLPVYWSSPDGQTQTSLGSLAAGTAQYWSEQSNGGIRITASSRGWAQIADPGSCSSSVIWNRALAAHGITSVGPNDHYAVYFPQRADCNGWAGLASIGGNSIWINGLAYQDVLAHEFGHNLGLGHANTTTCGSGTSRIPLVLPFGSCAVSEYADVADVMGYATQAASGNLTSAFADYLGLATVQRVSSTPVTVDLAPLSSVTALRSLAIPVVGGTLYVDFRPAAGRDVRKPAWAGVQVHLRIQDPRGFPTTYLLDMKAPTTTAFAAPQMAPGATWVIPGTNQVLTVVSVGATARVSVSELRAAESEFDTIGVFRRGAWYLRGASGGVAGSYGFGDPSDIPVMGDWDGNGTRTPGVFRAGTWYLRNTNNQGGADITLTYGSPGDVPVVGDWDGDGKDTVGVFRGGRWYLRNSNTSGGHDVALAFGIGTDTPVVGDWDGDGADTVGVFRGGAWHLTDSLTRPNVAHLAGYGSPGDVPVTGDWDGDGDDTIGIARAGRFYLSNHLDRGAHDVWFGFGDPGDRAVVYK